MKSYTIGGGITAFVAPFIYLGMLLIKQSSKYGIEFHSRDYQSMEFNSQRIDLAHQFDRRFLVLEHQHDRHDGHLKRSALVPTSNRNCQRSEKKVTDLKRVGASVGGDKPSCLLPLCKHTFGPCRKAFHLSLLPLI